jgi:hypothetical protein
MLANSTHRPVKPVGRQARGVAVRTALLAIGLAAVIAAVLLVDLIPSQRVALNSGDVSTVTILAPSDLSYESELRTRAAREAAAASVAEYYDPPDTTVARQQEVRARQILDFISTVRQDSFSSAEQKAASLEAIPDVELTPAVAADIVELSDDEWQQVRDDVIRVLTTAMQNEIQAGEVADISQRVVPALVGYSLSDKQSAAVKAIAGSLVRPNTFLNAAETDKARQRARDGTPAVTVTVRRGEAIVRAGDRVTAADVETLDAFGLRQQAVRWEHVIGTVGFALLVTFLLFRLISRIEPEFWARRRAPIVTVALIAIFAAVAKVMLPGSAGQVIPYFYPLPALSMFLTVFFGPALGVAAGLIVGLIAAFVTNGSLEIIVYVLAGTLVGVLALGHAERVKSFFLAGLAVALVNAVVIILFGLLATNPDWVRVALRVPVGVVTGGLAASLALAAFLALGPLLDIVTPFQLMELSRPTHPLMRQLLLKAPGTYHHSILVSNMAEEAAERIGADALLVRVGAYYHDIGKIVQPFYFAENRIGDVNPHEVLDPRTSAQIVISHVKDGIELANKYHLPSAIRDFIPEHQGTGLALAFYRMAVSAAGNGHNGGEQPEVREEDFRYPGPRPRTRETAIMMLADSCEARVRSSQPASPEEIEHIIRETIDTRVAEGQLDDANLTLRDLQEIRSAFFDTLRGLFHPRVKYPEPVKVRGPYGREIIR